jgi:hypothetical protein
MYPPPLCAVSAGGPNGPILPEIRAIFPNATLIPRPGEINAWDNTDFVKAVKARLRALLHACAQV